jgi:hypothetical protein
MIHNVNESIVSLLVEIDTLVPLPGNPRVGNIDAIMSSYDEFGQVKPIVARPNGDGTSTVIAGNHQLEAARRLGWTHIAVVPMDADDKRALAFAMADNRTMELGHTDSDLVAELISQISDDYSNLLDSLDYDAFEIAALEIHAERPESILDDGYVPPALRERSSLMDTIKDLADSVSIVVSEDGDKTIEALPSVDTSMAVTTGSTSVGAAGTGKAVVQYTLVFDDSDQQRKWYSFIRWLRNSPVYEGDTTAERLMTFIDAHSDVGP